MTNQIEGKDCMVQAVRSAVGGGYETLANLRLLHLDAQGNLALDAQKEAENLSQLLRGAGHSDEVRYMTVGSIEELEALLDDGHIFVGFLKGTDTPPHIVHIRERVEGGFVSDQEHTSDDRLAQALMEQGELTVYIAPDSF